MNKRGFLISLIIITTLTLSACQAQSSNTLEGTSWILVELNGKPILSETTVTLDLNGSTLTGNDGCNHIGGSYTSTGDSFSVGEDLMSTLMACEGAIMTQAGEYNEALRQASSYHLADNQLSLIDTDGKILAVFSAQSQELAGTSWLASYVNTGESDGVVSSSGIQAAQQTLVFDNQGKISGNAGCNNYFGTYQVEGNTLTFQEIGSTKMFCGDGLMAEESAYLAALQEAATYKITGGSLQIYAADDTTLVSLSLVK
ncbi:MAG: META domain-containing protein [Anaerolineaceae bacterium]|nr:META domain-containing protein [Anaerolineaceae bacterium]